MSVTECPCCVLCLVKIEDINEENSIFSKTDNNEKLFRKLFNFVKCRLKLGEFNFTKPSSSSAAIPTLCERCSEVASNLCDLHEELRSLETRMCRKLEEMEAILSLGKVTESTISNKMGMGEVERFRELLIRQVRWYFDVERSRSNEESSSKEDDVDSVSEAESEIKNDPENEDYDEAEGEPENEDDEDDHEDSAHSDTNFDDIDFIIEDDSVSSSSTADSLDSPAIDEFDDYDEEEKYELNSNEEEDPLKMEIEIQTDAKEEPQPTVTIKSQGRRPRKSAVTPRRDFDEFPVSVVEVPPVPSTSSSKNQYQNAPRPEPPQSKRPKLSDPGSNEESEMDWSSRPCGICKKRFASAVDLRHHMYFHEFKVKQAKKKPDFHCPFCRKVYYLEETLKVHLETEKHVNKYFSDLRFRCDGENGENECCTETYETFADLGHHLETRHPGATIHHCGTCKWPFLNESARDLHRLNHIDSIREGGYHCPIPNCSEVYRSNSSIACHFSKVHGTDLKPYRCPQPQCFYRNYTIRRINEHLNYEHKTATLNDKPLEFFCDICSVKSFNTLLKLRTHQKDCRKRGICNICGEKLLNSVELDKHKLQVHQVEPPRFVCDQCGKVCLTERGRKLHMQHHQEKKKAKTKTFQTVVCPHCGKVFHRERALKHHVETMHVQKTTGQERKRDRVCQDCGKAYFYAHTLRTHRITNHLSEEEKRKRKDRYRCPLCQKGFLVEEYLKAHIRTVHNGKKKARTKTFQTILCPHCGKVFHREKNLKQHVALIHVKETTGQDRKKDSVCQDCGNVYFSEKDLNKHRIMNHLSEEEQQKRRDRFRCPLCQKGFLLVDYLKGHIRTVHKVDPNETLNTSKHKRI